MIYGPSREGATPCNTRACGACSRAVESSTRQARRGEEVAELPELTPELFEILVVRELRKLGLEVSELRVHRRATLPEPERGYLVELKGRVSRGPWHRRVLIACRRQDAAVGRAEIESLRDRFGEADVEAGILFATAKFDRDALAAAQ